MRTILPAIFLALAALPARAQAQTPNTSGPLAFISSGTIKASIIDYFMARTYFEGDSYTSQAHALGGRFLYETPRLAGFSAGAALYTSQKMPFTPETTGGTNILQPGQKGFTTLGQAYLKYNLGKTEFTLFRQAIDSPFINTYDIKMVPITYEAYTVRDTSIRGLRLTASHITGIKTWVSDSFIGLPEAAGYDIDRPLTMAGAEYSPSDGFLYQLWNYQAYDYLNTSYFEAAGQWGNSDRRFTLSGQAMGQTDTGSAIAGRIKAAMLGVMAGAGTGGLNAQIAYTQAANGNDLVNPFASFPGYTSIMEEDCDLDGQKAWLLHLDYDFARAGLPGLTAKVNYTRAFSPPSDAQSLPTQHEVNFIVNYAFHGKLDGLSVLFKSAGVWHSQSLNDMNYNDFRLITRYDF